MTMPDASFEDHLAREIIHSERLRMAILAGLLGTSIVFFGLLYALFRADYQQIFSRTRAFFQAGLVFALLLCYELAIRHLIGRWLRQGRGVPTSAQRAPCYLHGLTTGVFNPSK